MKNIVDPQTAAAEASDQHGSNHPFGVLHLGPGNQIVRQGSAKGFTCARKAARRFIDGTHVVAVALTGSKDRVPAKFRDDFKTIRCGGRSLECFLVHAT